jgi:hypothetical protein
MLLSGTTFTGQLHVASVAFAMRNHSVLCANSESCVPENVHFQCASDGMVFGRASHLGEPESNQSEKHDRKAVKASCAQSALGRGAVPSNYERKLSRAGARGGAARSSARLGDGSCRLAPDSFFVDSSTHSALSSSPSGCKKTVDVPCGAFGSRLAQCSHDCL